MTKGVPKIAQKKLKNVILYWYLFLFLHRLIKYLQIVDNVRESVCLIIFCPVLIITHYFVFLIFRAENGWPGGGLRLKRARSMLLLLVRYGHRRFLLISRLLCVGSPPPPPNFNAVPPPRILLLIPLELLFN